MNSASTDESSPKPKSNHSRKKWVRNSSIGMPVGIAMGTGIGLATGNLLIGIIIGVVLGGIFGVFVGLLKASVRIEK